MKHIAIAAVLFPLAACGGAKPAADPPPEATNVEEVSEGPAESERPSDGIVRDADGDGAADKAGSGCDGKSQTQCQITAGCAWNTEGKCVEGDAGSQ